MHKKITDVAIKELSLIFGEHKGERWQPVNDQARVLSVKGESMDRKSLGAKVLETLKAYFSADTADESIQTWPVGEEVADTFDGDGDGSADYSAYALALCSAACDIQSAICLEEPARSSAIVAIVDTFRSESESKYGEKAGARNSAADLEHLNAIKDEVANHAKVINERLASLGVGDPDGESKPEDETNDNPTADEQGKAEAVLNEDGTIEKADKEPYGDVEYADPGYQDDKKKRYPLDTKKHVRAALSYIAMEKNSSKYSADDLAKVKSKIEAAAKKFGIETSDKAEVEDVVKAHVQALIAEKSAEFEQQLAAVKSEAQAQIESVKAESKSRVAELESRVTAADKRASEAEATAKALVKDARKPTSPGFVPTLREDGKREDPAKNVAKAAAINDIKTPTTIGEVIKLQRLASS